MIAIITRQPGRHNFSPISRSEIGRQHADHIGSTSSLLSYATTTPDADTFIVGTEPGILHQMQLAAPSRTFLPLPGMDETCACNECPHMRRNTLEKIRGVLAWESCSEKSEVFQAAAA
jgi:quinolinate synthase